MESFQVRGKTFYIIDADTVLCPQDEKYLVSEGLAVMAGEMWQYNPRLAELIVAKAEQERSGH